MCSIYRSYYLSRSHSIRARDRNRSTKIQAVREWPVPRSLREVGSFVDTQVITGASFKTMPNCSTITPVNKENARFDWTREQVSFDRLKQALTEAPVLITRAMSTSLYWTPMRQCGNGSSALSNGQRRGKSGGLCQPDITRALQNYCTTRRELLLKS